MIQTEKLIAKKY